MVVDATDSESCGIHNDETLSKRKKGGIRTSGMCGTRCAFNFLTSSAWSGLYSSSNFSRLRCQYF